MSMIFISYRRADAGGHAGRLFDRLRHWFDAEVIFYDVNSIDIGEVFPERIENAVNSAAVVLVLIGPDWLEKINQRIGQPGVDFVRREIELALARHADHKALVLPVLVGGATMPLAHQLHTDVQASSAPLCTLNAHRFQGNQADWENQFVLLREYIAKIPGIPAPRFRAPAGSEQPFRVIEHALSPHFQDPNGLLARLRAQLAASGSAAVLARAALYGMGGVGKTQLALKYSHAYRDLYAGVWWFRAENEDTMQLDAQACCAAVSAPLREGETPAAALKRWLELQTLPWLLVYDNAEGMATLRPHLPEGRLHHLVITSRNPAWRGLAQPVELEVWSPEQGADFLMTRQPGAARGELLKLADNLGGLPLALEQAASYLEQTGASVADYRAMLAAVNTEGLILDEGRAATGYERSVSATLSLAFAKLSPAAAQLLRLCAYAAPEPLPERFLREAADKLPPELAAAAADPLLWNRVAGELRGYGLAERSTIPALDRAPGETTDRTELALSLHRLTQQVTRARLAQPEKDCRNFLAVLFKCCPAETNLPAHWPRYAALAPHITQLDRYYTAGWLDTRRYSWLLDRVAIYLSYGPALYAQSVHWLRHAWEISKQEQGEDHPNTLASMNNLALTLSDQGDYPGARVLQEQVLEVRSRGLGEEHPDTLISMGNLAITLWNQGDLTGARALEEKALEVSRQVLGDEHLDTLSSMNNLAVTLRNQSDLTGARVLQEKVLEVRRRVLGVEHPDTLNSMNNLAVTLRNQGDLTGARVLQEKVLEVRRRVQGEDHPKTLNSMHNLAYTLWQMNEHLLALHLMQNAAEGRARVLGPDHPDTLSSRRDLEEMQATH